MLAGLFPAGLSAVWASTQAMATATMHVAASPAGPFEPLSAGNRQVPAAFPGEVNRYLGADIQPWETIEALAIELLLPTNAPPDVEALVFVKDRDGFWHQRLHSEPLAVGETQMLHVPFDAASTGWESVGHQGQWHYRSRLDPQEVGLRLFSSGAWTGTWELVSTEGRFDPDPSPGPPRIGALAVESLQVPIRRPFNLRFALPDRYASPFDPETVEAWAEILPPGSDSPVRVDAFYVQDFFVRTNAVRDRYLPQGRPHWRLRYAPRVAGEHRLVLHARDAWGEDRRDGLRFNALSETDAAPFIRVSEKDHRFFEGCDGTPFFPIGHNIRSPFDTRMDEQFPWRFRHPEAIRAYERYFRDMAAAGQNMVEIWLCNWSLGLEWTPTRPGYHGMGEYNLIHAWQLDWVVERARHYGLYINLVLKNHGRLSGWVDPEWDAHPINQANGGYLEDPMDFFTHARARSDYRRQLRYIVSRWGYSPHVFAWELWSELDLIGLRRPDPHPQHDPRVHAWLQEMGDYLHAIDPNQRMRACHLSSSYRIQNAIMAALPQLDFNPLNAYHFSDNPLQTAALLRQTVEANRPYGKPVLVTEFGGSHMAASTAHLRQDLRVGLWTSTATALAGTPLFWWWQVIEEQNLYPLFSSLSRYMDGEDRRDPELQAVTLAVSDAEGNSMGGNRLDVSCLASPRQAYAYLAVQAAVRQRAAGNDDPLPRQTGLRASLPVGDNAQYAVTFWDIDAGVPLRRIDVRARDDRLDIELPPFTKDLAFKLHRLDAGAGVGSDGD